MQWLFHSKTKDIPMRGVDWIMLSANAVGLAIVVTATLSAQKPSAPYAQAAIPTAVEMASLN